MAPETAQEIVQRYDALVKSLGEAQARKLFLAEGTPRHEMQKQLLETARRIVDMVKVKP